MSEPLFLKSLNIHGFRAFDQLSIDRLGRVNLIVGKNNVGKSSLLEALWLYACQGHPVIAWKILEARDEGRGPERTPQIRLPNTEDEGRDYTSAIKQLFYREGQNRQAQPAQIGPIGDEQRILTLALSQTSDQKNGAVIPAFKTQLGGQKNTYRLDGVSYPLQEGRNEECIVVTANGLDSRAVENFWDKVALTSLEDDVLNALRLIAPDVEKVNLLAGRKHRTGRIPVVKVVGVTEPVPLKSLGEGMNRMFGIALALVNAKDGVLLIDEIESGLHYSVQPDVWLLVFEVARRLNIQVFATTHSWDCLIAFQEAARKYEQDEGVLIRLTQKERRIVADLFDEEDLVIVAREGIEVR
ncbi:MAG: AAA family ATPase [Blastocatellia bacterium]